MKRKRAFADFVQNCVKFARVVIIVVLCAIIKREYMIKKK